MALTSCAHHFADMYGHTYRRIQYVLQEHVRPSHTVRLPGGKTGEREPEHEWDSAKAAIDEQILFATRLAGPDSPVMKNLRVALDAIEKKEPEPARQAMYASMEDWLELALKEYCGCVSQPD